MPVIINGSTGISGNDGTAATPTIRGVDNNTGVYFPGDDRIGFAEGGVQVGEFDAAGNFLFNSGYGSVAVAYACRAWVNFNGTGTVAIRASGNVSSITDHGTGDYTLNFTTAMPDTSYVLTGSCQMAGVVANLNVDLNGTGTYLANSCRMRLSGGNATVDGQYDSPLVAVCVFR